MVTLCRFLLPVALFLLGLSRLHAVTMAEDFSQLSLYFGVKPTTHSPGAEAVKAHEFAICELESHILRTSELPEATFRDPGKVKDFAPDGYQIQTTFFDEYGQEVTALDRVGPYAAQVQVSYEDRDYTFWRMAWRLPLGAELPEDTSELAVYRRLARESLGREWEPADPALYTFADRWLWEMDRCRGETKPLEWFALFPPDYEEDAEKVYPAFVYLHGSGAKRFTLEQLQADTFYESFAGLRERGCLIIVPLTHRAWEAPEVLDMLDRALAALRVDPERVAIGGHSMGGSGTYRVLEGAGGPERFAAAVPVAGGHVPPPERAPRFASLPIWALFGENDGPAAHVQTQALIGAVNAAGGNARFTVIDDANHMESRNRFFAGEEFQAWLMKQLGSAE